VDLGDEDSIHKEQRSARLIHGEQRRAPVVGNVRPLPPTNSHRSTFEKEFQNISVGEVLQFTLVVVEREEDLSKMYRKVDSFVMQTGPEVCLTQMSARKGIKTWIQSHRSNTHKIHTARQQESCRTP